MNAPEETSSAVRTARPLPRSPRYPAAIAVLLLLSAAALYLRAGLLVLPADLAQADPPAHFTTGVMVYDFLRHPGARPVRFAECFYVQYPKVAFGHWPPVFYVLEALWFFVFGAKIVAARWLCALIAAAGGAALFFRIRRFDGWWWGAVFAAVFLASPFVEREGWRVMSDLLLATLVFLALAALTDYLAAGRARDAWRFAAWSTIAVLTKGTGWLLLGVIAAAPLATRRLRIYRSASYWIAAAAICAVAAPFFLWVGTLHFSYPLRMAGLLHRLAVIVGRISVALWAAILVLAAGAAVALYRWLRGRELPFLATEAAVVLLWIVLQSALLALAPLTREWDRYFIASLAPALLLAARVCALLDSRIAANGFPGGKLAAAAACAAAIAAGARVHPIATTAYAQAAESIPVRREPVVIAVESDAAGEGALIAKRLEQDRFRSSYVVRGSKLLSVSDWSLTVYRLKSRDTAAVREALDANLVDFAVVDRSAPPLPTTPLLEAALRDSAWRWDIVASIPVTLGRRHGDLLVYRRESPKPSGNAPVSVELGPERGGRIIRCEDVRDRPAAYR